MMHWVLIAIVMTGIYDAPAAVTPYFETRDMCLAAEAKLVADLGRDVRSHQCALVSATEVPLARPR
jgi:hypothetical protein